LYHQTLDLQIDYLLLVHHLVLARVLFAHIQDLLDNVVTLIQSITLIDTTAPEIDLQINAYSFNKDRDEGTFSIFYDVRDSVDFAPVTHATLNGVPVTNNQFVNLKFDDTKSEVKEKSGLLEFSGTEFILEVISTDFSGNQNIASTTASFLITPPIDEIPIEEIPITELTFEDLQVSLNKLKSTPPSDLTNLGQELKKFKFIAKLLFEQEKNEIKNLKKEHKQMLKELDGDTKELKKEFKEIIKQSRDDFKSLHDQYKEIFKEYRTVAKLMLKEKKGLESDKLANEIKKIQTRLSQNEAERTQILDDETNQKQQKQDARTNELFSMLLNRISKIDLSSNGSFKMFNDIQTLKTQDITSKEKQKLMQVILKNSDKSLKDEFKELKKELKKNNKELKKSLKIQEKEAKQKEKALKKIEEEKGKLSKLQEKELKKIEEELKKIEKRR